MDKVVFYMKTSENDNIRIEDFSNGDHFEYIDESN